DSVALLELFLELGELAVADLRDALEVARTLLALRFAFQLVDSARDLLVSLECLLLLTPPCGERVADVLRVRVLAFDRLSHRLRLLRHRGQHDFEPADAPTRI